MHEMSIALGIVKIATEESVNSEVDRFTGIDLEIGSLAGIEIDALNFVWEAAVRDSVLENAEKKIQIIQAMAKCIDCQNEYKIDFIHQPCPTCDGFRKEILNGKELRVKNLYA